MNSGEQKVSAKPGSDPGGADHQVSHTLSVVQAESPPAIPDHELLRCIGRGSYGEVWLERTVLGDFRAVRIVYGESFEHDRPFEREFEGIQKFEPISRLHERQVDILHVGSNDAAGHFF